MRSAYKELKGIILGGLHALKHAKSIGEFLLILLGVLTLLIAFVLGGFLMIIEWIKQ